MGISIRVFLHSAQSVPTLKFAAYGSLRPLELALSGGAIGGRKIHGEFAWYCSAGHAGFGFGIGAAVAHSPVAAADTSTDAASTVDGLLSGVSPAPATAINLDISFDGYTIYDGGGTAVANTGAEGNGLYDFAIAYGAGAHA